MLLTAVLVLTILGTTDVKATVDCAGVAIGLVLSLIWTGAEPHSSRVGGDLVKCLWWDTQGMVLYAAGFTWPQAKDGAVPLTPAQNAACSTTHDLPMSTCHPDNPPNGCGDD